MLPVSAAELAAGQAEVVAAVCDKTCLIYRKTGATIDAYGSQIPGYTLIVTTVAGMSEPSGTDLANYAYLIESKAAWTVRLPVGTNVEEQDYLSIEGHTLEVHKVLTPRSYQFLLSVLTAEVA